MMNEYSYFKHIKKLKPTVLTLHVIALFMLSGCAIQQAPAFPIFGSYFPSWMACALFGIVIAVIARVVFIRIGIDDSLPARLLVYVCLALIVAFVSSSLIFSH
ncbi:YtcA family lipoprotein [Pantoea agglomerans]